MKLKRGLYFEEMSEGQLITSQGRTITEADIVNFCGFTGDWSELHTNAEYGATTPFGQRIAHGMLTMSVATGLAVMTGFIEDTIVAFEGISDWAFKRPVFIGDTIYVESKVIAREVRQLVGGMKAGHVTLDVQVKKQRGKICQQGKWSMLVKMKEPA